MRDAVDRGAGAPLLVASTVPVVAAALAAVVLGGLPPVPVAVAVGVLAVVGLAVRLRGVEDVAVALVVLAVGTATWNGLTVGGLQIAHGALAVALAALAAVAVARRHPVRVPAWVWVLGAAIVVVTACAVLWPTPTAYLAARAQVPVPDALAPGVMDPGVANLVNAGRWLVASVALPVVACLATRGRPHLPGVLASAWALGAAASALVGLSDAAGLTAVSARLLPLVDIGGRQAGLSAQPNHLAVAAALVAPVVVWRLLQGRRVWLVPAIALAGGLIVAGSRGGLVAAVLAVLLTLALHPRGRRVALPLGGAVAVGGALVVALAPDRVVAAAAALRLSGAASAAESDAVRADVGAQALADFARSPLRGIGLEVIADGHNIVLQLLAAGGVLLLLGFVVAAAGGLADAWWRRDAHGGLSRALAVATVVWLVLGLVENQLTDVFLYVPLALVAALAVTGPLPVPSSVPVSAPTPIPTPALARPEVLTMTFPALLRAVRERWLLVVVTVLVALLVAGGVTLFAPRHYEATASLYVSAQDESSSPSAYQGGLLSQQRVTSYSELIVSDRVLRTVVERLALPMTAAELADEIAVRSASESTVLAVGVTDRSPLRAAQIADAVAVRFTEVVGELERPRTPGAAPAVDVSVVDAATTPTEPSSPRPAVDLALGLVLGLVLGVAAAVVRAGLDTTVRDTDDLASAADATALGALPVDEGLRAGRGAAPAYCEAVRRVRTNLLFASVDGAPTVLTVTSARAGEGKTTLVWALAEALAPTGRVCVVEGDLRRPSLADRLGLVGGVGLTDVLTRRTGLGDALQRRGAVDVLPCGTLPPNPGELVSSAAMRAVLEQLAGRYDTVLVDAPPLLPVADAAVLATRSDAAILLAERGVTTRGQVSRAVAALRAVDARLVGTVLGMDPPASRRDGGGYEAYGSRTPGTGSSTGGPTGHLPVETGPATPPVGEPVRALVSVTATTAAPRAISGGRHRLA